jgi:hypothetical protein
MFKRVSYCIPMGVYFTFIHSPLSNTLPYSLTFHLSFFNTFQYTALYSLPSQLLCFRILLIDLLQVFIDSRSECLFGKCFENIAPKYGLLFHILDGPFRVQKVVIFIWFFSSFLLLLIAVWYRRSCSSIPIQFKW